MFKEYLHCFVVLKGKDLVKYTYYYLNLWSQMFFEHQISVLEYFVTDQCVTEDSDLQLQE